MRDGLAHTCGGLKWPDKRLITAETALSLLRTKAYYQWHGQPSLKIKFDPSFNRLTISNDAPLGSVSGLTVASTESTNFMNQARPRETRSSIRKHGTPLLIGTTHSSLSQLFSQIEAILSRRYANISPIDIASAVREGMKHIMQILESGDSPSRTSCLPKSLSFKETTHGSFPRTCLTHSVANRISRGSIVIELP